MTEETFAPPEAANTAEEFGRLDTVRPLPRHLAVILDGNRRWATEHQMPMMSAYRLGAQRVHELVEGCDRLGVEYVTVWALSRANLDRQDAAASRILDVVLDGLAGMAMTGRWRIRVIGAAGLLGEDQAVRLAAIESDTRGFRHVTVNVALAYDGRAEIVEAVRAMLEDDRPPGMPVTERTIARYLSTAGQPDIDLLIRTSGEKRLSGFMPWQTAQAELYFTDAHWPDFTPTRLKEALDWFALRDRRFGL